MAANIYKSQLSDTHTATAATTTKKQQTAFIGISIFPELGTKGGDLFTRDTRECMDAWGVHVITVYLFILSRSHVNQTQGCTYNYLNMCVHIYKRVPVKNALCFRQKHARIL